MCCTGRPRESVSRRDLSVDTWRMARRCSRATPLVAVVLACVSGGAAQTTVAPGASIASAGLRDGRWVTTSQSAEAWLANQRSTPAGAQDEEPVSHDTVHVDDGQLAFVRAEATLMRDGQARSSNIDYFTLLRNGHGEWKLVNGL